MAEIDKNSETWRAVTEWAERRREQAVSSLIQGAQGDDKLRGDIRTLDDLLSLTDPAIPEVPAAHYD